MGHSFTRERQRDLPLPERLRQSRLAAGSRNRNGP